MAHTVFICHSARDKQVADAACAALEARRIPCWIAPRDILGGDEWGKAIVDAINDCRIVLLIFSAHANTSPQVRREVERAVSKAKIIVPFRIEDVLPSDAMEYALGNPHWLDALTPPAEAHLATLADTISRILQRDQPSEPLFTPPPPPPPGAAAPVTTPKTERPSDSTSTAESLPTAHRSTALWVVVAAIVLISAASLFFWRRHSATQPSTIIAKSVTSPTAVPAGPATPTLQQAVPSPDPAALTVADSYKRGDKLYWQRSSKQALPFLERACDGGNGYACHDLSDIYELGGYGISKDRGKSITLLRRSCSLGDASECWQLGNYYDEGLEPFVPKDLGQAIAFESKSCDGGYYAGCAVLAQLYLHDGATQNIPQAMALFRKLCEGGGNEECRRLGLIYENGEYVPKDISQAIAFYRKACDGGWKMVCTEDLKRVQP